MKLLLDENLSRRLGVVAVVEVGAATETGMKEKEARVEDALHATRVAVEEDSILSWARNAERVGSRS